MGQESFEIFVEGGVFKVVIIFEAFKEQLSTSCRNYMLYGDLSFVLDEPLDTFSLEYCMIICYKSSMGAMATRFRLYFSSFCLIIGSSFSG